MAAPKFLKNRKNRLITTFVILLVCAAIAIYYGTLPEKTILNFFGVQFGLEGSRSIIITVAIIFGVIGGILTNLVSGDIHESIKEEVSTKEDPVKRAPEVIVPTVKIENIINQPGEAGQSAPSELKNQKFYPNYFLPDLKFFVGRAEVLQKIKETLVRNHRVAIHDISGLGKTFTTYKFAEANQKNYDKIFFIRATKEEMLESLAKCGEMVNPQLANVQEQKEKSLGFKQWLEENEKWLIIYDNVDSPKELFPFVPVNKKGDCLFTSNFRDITALGTEIIITKLSHPDDEILLFSRANNQPHKVPELDGEEKTAFENLLREIDGLPLTLNSTGALISKKDWTFVRSWQKYEQTPSIAWESEDDYSTYQRRSAGIVFSMVYDQLCEAENTGRAVELLLNAMSFLSPDEIPEDLLQEILRNHYKELAKVKEPEDFWDEVREKLTDYDLLKYDKYKQTFTTHRAIQRVIQTKLENKEKEAICKKLLYILLRLSSNFSDRKSLMKYYKHAQILFLNAYELQLITEDDNAFSFLSSLYLSQSMVYYLKVSNIPRSLAFYRDKLGLEVVKTPEQENNSDSVVLGLGGGLLVLYVPHEETASFDNQTFYISCSDVDEAYAHLRTQGFDVKKPYLTNSGMKAVSVTDPDGRTVCLLWPTEEP